MYFCGWGHVRNMILEPRSAKTPNLHSTTDGLALTKCIHTESLKTNPCVEVSTPADGQTDRCHQTYYLPTAQSIKMKMNHL